MSSNLAQRVIDWQRQWGRHNLPWQNTQDPYLVWLSEIMLQQTQVTTVMGYFNRFVERFPNVESLAIAPLEEVLLYWAGLGYYARARHLHACAQQVVTVWGGQFPPHAESLKTLPGIGPSTAAAIAAFCFGERTPILDGNVKRLYCRYFGVEGDPNSSAVVQRLWHYAKLATPSLAQTLKQPDAMTRFTQGLMDLGATCCTRRQPSCNRCPLASDCVAQLTSRTSELPFPRTRRVLRERSIIMLIIHSSGPTLSQLSTSNGIKRMATQQAILLQKRPGNGIWGGLWSLPECGIDDNLSENSKAQQKPSCHKSDQPQTSESIVRRWCAKNQIQSPTLLSMAAFRHTFTHFHLHIQPWSVQVNEETGVALQALNDTSRWVKVDQLHLFGMPAPVKNLVLNFTVP